MRFGGGGSHASPFLFVMRVNDSISQIENDFFMAFEAPFFVNETSCFNLTAEHTIIISSMTWNITGESLDALSTNTLRVRVNEITTTSGFTVDDSTGTGIIFVDGFEEEVAPFTKFNMQWASDSVGTINIRGFSMGGRFA